MAVLKSGDLVVLKSGGPVMTVDAVNTDIFDDNKITGILCAWFVGDKLQRARFDYAALEPAPLPCNALPKADSASQEVGEYKTVLDEMVAAMNDAADAPRLPAALNGAVAGKSRRPSSAKSEPGVSGPPASAQMD